MTTRSAQRAPRLGRALFVLPPVAFAGVLGLDVLARARHLPLLVKALLDEPAHLMTAGLLLAALPVRPGRWWCWALVGSVAIDVDHVPLYTVAPHFVAGGRPPTHSLLTVLVLLVVALVLPSGRRLVGLAVGVVLHLVRDLATGPGVALWWPVSHSGVRVPYDDYVVLLAVATLLATARAVRAGRVRSAAP